MNNLDRIKSLRAQDYGVAGLSTTDVDWLIAEVERLTAERGVCPWIENDDGIYTTGCNNCFEFIDGGPADNGAVYCQYCGKVIDQHYYNDMPEWE